MPIPIQDYFRRINYRGNRILSADTLKKLHRQHVLSIPFENLDIHLGRPILLDENSLYQKLVQQNRGGYCYEMNGLFAIYLRQLWEQPACKVNYLNARVLYNQESTIPRTHMLLQVELAGSIWICDVGFGGNGLLEPIPLRVGEYSQILNDQLFGKFQLLNTGFQKYLLKTQIKDQWQDLYEFTLEEFLFVDFKPFNFFQSHSPETLFTNKILCMIPSVTDKIILDNLTLKTHGQKPTVPHMVSTVEGYQTMLAEYFNICIDKHELEKLTINATGRQLFP